MTFKKIGQTSTEYLIILAVVIVITLIVVGIMGDIPGIGGKTGKSTESLSAQSQSIGVMSTVTTLYGTSFILRNNLVATIQLNNISIDGVPCYTTNNFTGGYVPDISQKITAGKTLEVTCQAFRYTADSETDSPVSDNVYGNESEYKGNLVAKSTGDEWPFLLSFDYTNTKTGGSYSSKNISITSPIVGGIGYK